MAAASSRRRPIIGTARARSHAKTRGAVVAMPSHARMNHESQKAIALPLGRVPKAPVASVPNVADTMAPAGAATRVSTSGSRTRSRRASNCNGPEYPDGEGDLSDRSQERDEGEGQRNLLNHDGRRAEGDTRQDAESEEADGRHGKAVGGPHRRRAQAADQLRREDDCHQAGVDEADRHVLRDNRSGGAGGGPASDGVEDGRSRWHVEEKRTDEGGEVQGPGATREQGSGSQGSGIRDQGPGIRAGVGSRGFGGGLRRGGLRRKTESLELATETTVASRESAPDGLSGIAARSWKPWRGRSGGEAGIRPIADEHRRGPWSRGESNVTESASPPRGRPPAERSGGEAGIRPHGR